MKYKPGDQMFLEDPPTPDNLPTEQPEERLAEPRFVDHEKINCQYCQDGGPCTFCDRGKNESWALKKLKRNS